LTEKPALAGVAKAVVIPMRASPSIVYFFIAARFDDRRQRGFSIGPLKEKRVGIDRINDGKSMI